MNIIKLSYLIILISIASPAISQSEEKSESVWSWIKNKSNELVDSTAETSGAMVEKTQEGTSSATNYISKRYAKAKDGSIAWTKESYIDFSNDYPDISKKIEAFALSSASAGELVFEKTTDGSLVAYTAAADGKKAAVSWTQDKLSKVPEITACDIAEYDFLGGAAIGTLGTAITAGASTTTTTVVAVGVAPTIFGWVPMGVLSAATSVVSVPAVAIGVTATALAGATVYATSKGICYYQENLKE